MTRYRSTYPPRRGGSILSGLLRGIVIIAVVIASFGLAYVGINWGLNPEGPVRSIERYTDAREDSARFALASFEDEASAREACGEYAVEAIGPDESPRGWRCPEDMVSPE